MRTILIALGLAALAAGPVAASDKTDVMAVLHQFVAGFNKGGDMHSILATCADRTSVIDDFPPNEWDGAGACSKWLSDFIASNRADEITDGFITLSEPRHIAITAQRAYIVAPVTFTFKKKGKPMKASGSILTFALQNGVSGWRIVGWSYSAGAVMEVPASLDPRP